MAEEPQAKKAKVALRSPLVRHPHTCPPPPAIPHECHLYMALASHACNEEKIEKREETEILAAFS